MKKSVLFGLFGLILLLLSLIPFVSSSADTQGQHVRVCEQDIEWEFF